MMPMIREALEYQDLRGMIKPTIHVDEFASKMGDDEDIIVISFFLRDQHAARDLMYWFEKGYDWVLDADVSPGEIRPNRYLVYVEMRRRSTAGGHVSQMLEDLATLTDIQPDQWIMHYDDKTMPFTTETFERTVPLTPRDYRKQRKEKTEDIRTLAGIDSPRGGETPKDLQALQSAAGVI